MSSIQQISATVKKEFARAYADYLSDNLESLSKLIAGPFYEPGKDFEYCFKAMSRLPADIADVLFEDEKQLCAIYRAVAALFNGKDQLDKTEVLTVARKQYNGDIIALQEFLERTVLYLQGMYQESRTDVLIECYDRTRYAEGLRLAKIAFDSGHDLATVDSYMVTPYQAPASQDMSALSAFEERWLALQSDEKRPVFDIGSEWSPLEIAPQRLTVLAGLTGSYKTTFALRLAVTAMLNDPTLKVGWLATEMSADSMLDKIISRMAIVDYNAIMNQTLNDFDKSRIGGSLDVIRDIASRISFIRGDVTLETALKKADAFGAKLFVCDYVQQVETEKIYGNPRERINHAMGCLCRWKQRGGGVLCVSSLARDNTAGNDVTKLEVYHLKESGNVGYDCDQAVLIGKDANHQGVLKIAKNRHGVGTMLALEFRPDVQTVDCLGRYQPPPESDSGSSKKPNQKEGKMIPFAQKPDSELNFF